MSLASEGSGWWQASDSLWYAPEYLPGAQPPAPAHGTGSLGKERGPAAILGLSIITLGIYFVYWWGTINGEIKRHDPDIKVSPAWSVLAMVSVYFIWFPIFAWVSIYTTAARIRQMQLDEGATQTISPVVALLLGIFLGIGVPLYIGSQLKEHWHGHRRQLREAAGPA